MPFDVPAGVERITVTLTYDKADKTVVDMGVWDPERFRGWSGGTRDRFTLSPSDATPGYLAGTRPGRPLAADARRAQCARRKPRRLYA